MLRFGIAALAVTLACGHASERKEPLSNHVTAPATGLTVGEYSCRLDEGGYQYPPFRCVVSMKGPRMWIEKVGGSVRFRGWLTRRGDAYAFEGEKYCPWGDCTEHVTTELVAEGPGSWRGTVTSAESAPMIVTLSRDDGAFGGGGYGGYGYGGGGYGGYGYGGVDPTVYDDP